MAITTVTIDTHLEIQMEYRDEGKARQVRALQIKRIKLKKEENRWVEMMVFKRSQAAANTTK